MSRVSICVNTSGSENGPDQGTFVSSAVIDLNV